ncbi:MAG: hypothetical protein E7156_00340 [Streptococcus gallolyticus]|uniref:Uncharacterized protein n=1 Tax=Streptococcus gallolyticus TaxID=315405 RepID=A0A927XJ51_9STRE|nr:hypothetical protein [Streptococcus gallolyticus]
MSYSVLRKGEVIASHFSTQEEAQSYIDNKCDGFFGDSRNDYEIRNDGGCYLTTATVEHMGFEDNCYQLNILREYRDNYLAKFQDGANDIEHYYKIAPDIVSKINSSSNKDEILNNIYNQLIIPCISLIENKEFDKAHKLYKNYTLQLEKYFKE